MAEGGNQDARAGISVCHLVCGQKEGTQQGTCLGQCPLGRSNPPRTPLRDSCPILGAATDGGSPRTGVPLGVQPTALAERWTDGYF